MKSCQLHSPPELGEVTSLDQGSGAFGYVSQLDVVGEDSFELDLHTEDGDSGRCTVSIDVEPMNFTELWATRDVIVTFDGADQGACENGEFEIQHDETALELADRVHTCGSSTATHNGIAFTLDDGVLSYSGTEVGRVGPSSIEYDHCLGSNCVTLSISRVHGQELFDYHEIFSGTDLEAESSGQLRATGARLIAVEGNSFYFRDALPISGIPSEQTIQLQNIGTSPALDLDGSFDNELFAFKAGEFPGEGGTCQTSLEPGLECTLTVEYRAVSYTMSSADLTLGYENLLGPAELILHLNGSARAEIEFAGESADQRFGFRVAGSGQAVAVSAADGLRLYRRTGDEWAQENAFLPDPVSDIDLEGDLLIFGQGTSEVLVYIYRHGDAGWSLEGTLASQESGDGFGGRVAVSDSLALVACNISEAVNTYRLDGGSWQFVEQLSGTAGTSFGSNLALDGDTALISSTTDGGGSVGVYLFNGTSWDLQQTLTVDDSTIDTHVESFGGGIDLDGDWAVASGYEFARGTRAFIFHREGGSWTQAQVFGSGYTDFSDGDRVAVEGPWMVTAQLGSFNDNGHTFVLKLSDGQWQNVLQIPTGYAVDAAETFVVTGEPYETVHGIGSDVGMFRIYE